MGKDEVGNSHHSDGKLDYYKFLKIIVQSCTPSAFAGHQSSGSSKTKLGDMKSPHTKRITKISHQQMCVHVATKQGFSIPGVWETLCWQMIVKAIKTNPVLWKKMKDNIQGNEEAKAQLIDYVSANSFNAAATHTKSPRSGKQWQVLEENW